MAEQVAGVSLAEVLKGIAQRKFFITAATFCGLIAGLAILMVFKPSYQTEAQVIIENLQTPYEKTSSQQQDFKIDPIDKNVVLSQVSVIKSSDIQQRVIDKLGLAQKPEFNPLLEGVSLTKKLAVMFGFADDPNLLTPKERAAKKLDLQLTVYPLPDSNVIGVKYVSADKQTASDVANAIVETYVNSTRENGATSNDRAKLWLAQQIADLRSKVAASDNAVEQYRTEAGLLKGERTTLSTQQISEMNSQITVARTAAAEAQARVTEIKAMLTAGAIDASSDVLSSPLILGLKQSQVAAQQRVSQLSATYLPNHPKMIAAQNDLNNINSQLRREALKIVDSLQSQSKVAAARAASLQSDLDKLKGQESVNNISDVKLQELERDADANRKLLESMLSRFADVNARQDLSLQPGMARIIQRAVAPPAPYFPKPGPIVLLTTLAGLVLGLGLAFVAEVISATSRVANEPTVVSSRRHPAYETLSAGHVIPPLPVNIAVAPVPREVQRQPEVSSSFPAALTSAASLAMAEQGALDGESSMALAGKRLASTIQSLNKEKGFRTFSVMSFGSAAPNAALATVAAARALSNEKCKVIAIDLAAANAGGFDMLFGLPSGQGLSELLAGEADFTKIVARDPQSTAHAIRFGLNNSAESISFVQQRLPQVIEALSSIYSIILLHLGEARAATPTLAGNADVAIMLPTLSRQKDALSAGPILQSKGVGATVTMRLEPQPMATPRPHAASA